jgi:hypothetical protein
MPREKADEANADEEGCDLDIMAYVVARSIKRPTRIISPCLNVCAAEEGRCRHAPGSSSPAGILTPTAAARQQQHQHKSQ